MYVDKKGNLKKKNWVPLKISVQNNFIWMYALRLGRTRISSQVY